MTDQQSTCRPLPPGYTAFYDQPMRVYASGLADEEILEEMRAAVIDVEQNAIVMRAIFELAAASVLTGDGSGTPLPAFDGMVPRVFLPEEPVAEEAPVEETQPAPSGWRDRPGML